MAVGSTVVKPGESTSFAFPFAMHAGMGGPHHFIVQMKTNDPDNPTIAFNIYANAVDK